MSQSQETGNSSDTGGMDPEIAELMGIDEEEPAAEKPDFDELFGGEGSPVGGADAEPVDLSKKRFSTVTNIDEDPKPIFRDKDYYKTAVGGEGEDAKRFHRQLALFLNAEDPQEKSMHRGKLLSAYWNFVENIAAKTHMDLPVPKKMVLRFGAVVPNLMSAEQRKMLSRIIMENNLGEPVHYVDEWMRKVALGEISQSATDEVKAKKKDDAAHLNAQLEKARGQKETHFGLLHGKLEELEAAEIELKEAVNILTARPQKPGYSGLRCGYSEEQRSQFTIVNKLLRQLSTADREVARLYNQLDSAAETLEVLEDKASTTASAVAVDRQTVRDEFNTIRQMAKLCVGRQGNHMPILMKQYFRPNLRDIGIRENVVRELAYAENIDPGAFERTFKRQTNRIVPNVILIPCYGDMGICWEPFERFNRATSRGRIAVPIFPKDLRIAVLSALGDLRWQVAKEKAQHYWMEEGLTGYYYQWFSSTKKRGDVREFFIQDYILWITKESEGMQKLDREVRGVFWRHMPFPQDIKDKLRTRGFVYDELYKKDKNRAVSDGY